MLEHEKPFLDEIKAETRDLRSKSELSALLGERVLCCVLLRAEGRTYKEIGQKLNVVAQSARQLFFKGWRKYYSSKKDNSGFGGLSVRAQNCLKNAGIVTAEQARSAIFAGELTETKYRGVKVQNYGKKSFLEICDHLGIDQKTTNFAIERAIKLLESNGYEVRKLT